MSRRARRRVGRRARGRGERHCLRYAPCPLRLGTLLRSEKMREYSGPLPLCGQVHCDEGKILFVSTLKCFRFGRIWSSLYCLHPGRICDLKAVWLLFDHDRQEQTRLNPSCCFGDHPLDDPLAVFVCRLCLVACIRGAGFRRDACETACERASPFAPNAVR